MSAKQIRFEYDPEVDAAYLTLNDGKIHDSEEAQSGIVIDFDSRHRVVGVEILRFAARFAGMAQPNRKSRAGNGHKKIVASTKN